MIKDNQIVNMLSRHHRRYHHHHHHTIFIVMILKTITCPPGQHHRLYHHHHHNAIFIIMISYQRQSPALLTSSEFNAEHLSRLNPRARSRQVSRHQTLLNNVITIVVIPSSLYILTSSCRHHCHLHHCHHHFVRLPTTKSGPRPRSVISTNNTISIGTASPDQNQPASKSQIVVPNIYIVPTFWACCWCPGVIALQAASGAPIE